MAKKILKKKVETPSYNKTEMENSQLELFRLKDQKKMLEKRENELKQRLGDYMAHSFKPDSKGHFLFTVLNEKGEKIHLQKQARKKITLNDERAISYLENKGLTDAIVEKQVVGADVTQDQIIEVLEKFAPHLLDKKIVVDEPTIEQMLGNEQIPMEDFEELCDINITYAMTFIDDKKLQSE